MKLLCLLYAWLYLYSFKVLYQKIKKGRLINIMKLNKLSEKLCCKVRSFFYKKEPIEKTSLSLKSLTPTTKIEDESYLEILKWAIDNKEITNIALSGAYGSGKSSILKAFESYYRCLEEYKVLNLSLATFKEKCDSLIPQEEDSNEENGQDSSGKTESVDIDQEQIEKSILQQMMYKESPNTVPNSRFKRIRNTKNFFRNTLFLVIWLISLVELFTPYTAIFHLYNYADFFDSMMYILNTIFIMGLGFFIYNFLKKTSNIKLDKLSLKSPEITLNENDTEISILNKHIDEIIYFFERTQYTIVVIEDLDRFNHPEIYIKLRELNKLLNASSQIVQPINFVYAIRDNMFVNKERTKFFDFFIPVIPVINATNSFAKLKQMFEEANLLEKMTESFLKDISRYIHDMRLLRNIFNEFVQYKEHLERNYRQHAMYEDKIPSINFDEMLAIVVYKNHYPNDFANLHEHKGLVYDTFNRVSRELRLTPIITKYNKKISELTTEIKKLNDGKVINIKELRAEYIYKFIEKQSNLIAFYFTAENNKHLRTTIQEVINSETLFDEFRNSNQIRFWYLQHPQVNNTLNHNVVQFNFTELERELSDYSFDERVKLLDEDKEEKQDKLKHEINEQKVKINKVNQLSIRELVNEYGIESILPKELFNGDKALLKYLISYGYINKHYKEYISYYHAGDETLNDITFVTNIRNRVYNVDYFLELNQFEKILADISEDEFTRSAILNYGLLEHLLEKNSVNGNENRILKMIIACEKTKRFDFIIGAFKYLDLKNIQTFVNMLLSRWKTFIEDYFSTDITNEQKDEVAVILIEYTPKYNLISKLNSYIKTKKTLLDFIVRFKDEEKFTDYISYQGLEFERLEDYNYESSDVFKFIYDKGNYAFNPYMLKVVLEIDDSEIEQYNTQNFKTILETKKEKVQEFVFEYIDLYVQDVYLELPNNTKDDASVLQTLFNYKEIEEEYIIEVFNRTESVFELITDLPEFLRKLALMNNRIKPTLTNIVNSLMFEGYDEKLVIKFIDSNIDSFYCDTEYSKIGGEAQKLIETLLVNEELSLRLFNAITKNLNHKFEKFNGIENLNDDKLDSLISNNYLLLNVETYEPIRDDGNLDIKIKLFENEQDSILDYWDNGILHLDIEMILQSKKIRTDIKSVIIVEKLEEEMLQEFNSTDDTNEAIYDIVMKDIKESSISDFLYLHLIQSNVSINKKIALFDKYKSFTRNLIDLTLDALGYPYKRLKHDGYRGKEDLKNTEHNRLLVNKLRAMDYVGSVDIKKYTIYINKLQIEREIKNK